MKKILPAIILNAMKTDYKYDTQFYTVSEAIKRLQHILEVYGDLDLNDSVYIYAAKDEEDEEDDFCEPSEASLATHVVLGF